MTTPAHVLQATADATVTESWMNALFAPASMEVFAPVAADPVILQLPVSAPQESPDLAASSSPP